MKMRYGLALIASGLLAACSGVGVNGGGVSLGLGLGGTIGRHVGLGTSINIPLKIDQNKSQTDKSGINVIDEKIITYFDAQGQTSDSAVKGGFSRQLLAKQGDDYVVQDFYATGEKRTEPMTLTRAQLFDFRAHPNNGAHTVYAINGNIMQQNNFRDGKLIK